MGSRPQDLIASLWDAGKWRAYCLASLLSTSVRSVAASSPWRLHWSRAAAGQRNQHGFGKQPAQNAFAARSERESESNFTETVSGACSKQPTQVGASGQQNQPSQQHQSRNALNVGQPGTSQRRGCRATLVIRYARSHRGLSWSTEREVCTSDSTRGKAYCAALAEGHECCFVARSVLDFAATNAVTIAC